jgi:hypothetical protein
MKTREEKALEWIESVHPCFMLSRIFFVNHWETAVVGFLPSVRCLTMEIPTCAFLLAESIPEPVIFGTISPIELFPLEVLEFPEIKDRVKCVFPRIKNEKGIDRGHKRIPLQRKIMEK